jgi:hypothetical protein
MSKFAAIALAGVIAAASLSGCSWTPREQNSALVGGAVGAGVGALATHSVGGAVVGAGVGTVAGYLVGKNSYRCQKRNMFGTLYWGTCFRR